MEQSHSYVDTVNTRDLLVTRLMVPMFLMKGHASLYVHHIRYNASILL